MTIADSPSTALPAPLLVGLDDLDVRILVDALARRAGGSKPPVRRAADCTEAAGQVQPGDLVFVDIGGAGAEAIAALAALRERAPAATLVALARFEKEPAITLALRAGADEFLIKGLYGAGALDLVLAHAGTRTAEIDAEADTRYRAISRDPDTGLPNTQLFGDMGRYASGVAFRSGGQLALCSVLVEGAADDDAEVPKAIAAILREATRETDALARLLPQEYAVLLGPVISPGEVERVLRRIIERIHAVKPAQGELSVVAGVAQFPQHSDTYEQLLLNARLAASQARHEGRGSLKFYALGLRGGIG